MSNYKNEQALALENQLAKLDNALHIITNLESYNFNICTPEGDLTWDVLNFNQRETDSLTDVLITAVNRNILEIEREIEEIGL